MTDGTVVNLDQHRARRAAASSARQPVACSTQAIPSTDRERARREISTIRATLRATLDGHHPHEQRRHA